MSVSEIAWKIAGVAEQSFKLLEKGENIVNAVFISVGISLILFWIKSMIDDQSREKAH